MRNILTVDLTNEICNGVYSSDCGSNCAQLILNIGELGLTKPYLYFILPDNTIVQTGILDVENNFISYEIPDNILNTDGTIIVKLKDDTGYESKEIYMEAVSYVDTDILICKYVSGKFVFCLYDSMKEKDELIVSATEPTGDNREKVWIQKGKNLFNAETDIESRNAYRYYADGILSPLEDYNSIKIRVEPSTTYVASSNFISGHMSNLCFFDESMKFISGNEFNNDNNRAFTTPSNCRYITIAVHNTYIWFQLEQGTVATEYEAYIEPKIYVKNDNGMYEKFISKDDTLEVYSTNERIVGKWTDEKPVYRKVIEGTLSSTEDTTTIDLGGKIIPRNFYGDIYIENLKLFVPLNYANPVVPIYTYVSNSDENSTINIVTPHFKGSDYMVVIEYIKV